jgi:hypothetical protein
MISRSLWVATMLALVSSSALAKDTYLVIIAGLGGDESYREKFHQWSMEMRDAAVERHGVAEDKVFYLTEKPELHPAAYAKSTKEDVMALFAELEPKVAPGDQLFVLLIGHGSFRSEESRFNLPGPDLTAEEFDLMLEPFSEQQIVFVNASSASGNFVPVLAGANRVVVTATKSGYERNESQFGGYFVEAYAGDGADTDKNGRISVLEAFAHARARVDGYYDEENILKTEHAILDDDGDGEGVHDLGESEGDIAGTVYLLGDAASAEGFTEADVAGDPELAALVEKKLELEGRVEALRLQKDSMPEDLYMAELETLLLELAAVTAQIEEKR